MDYEVVGSIKIKDGLFLGDEYAAQDLEFVVTNKVTRIINCAGKQIPNHWNTVGVQYLTYGFLENDNQTIFDPRDEVLHTTFKFIEEAIQQGDAILIHSVRGHNRSVCIIAAYMMRKFRWTLYKTLEFLHSRRPDLEIRASFFNQLLTLENRLAKIGLGAKTYNWKEVADPNNNNVNSKDISKTNSNSSKKEGISSTQNNNNNNSGGSNNMSVAFNSSNVADSNLENEEVLLTNTFLNSKNQELAEYNNIDDKEINQKITWLDQGKSASTANSTNYGKNNNNNGLVKTSIPPYDSCHFRKYRYGNGDKKPIQYKSIVKGSGQDFEYLPQTDKYIDQSENNKQNNSNSNGGSNNTKQTPGFMRSTGTLKNQRPGSQSSQQQQNKYGSQKELKGSQQQQSNNFMRSNQDSDNEEQQLQNNSNNNTQLTQKIQLNKQNSYSNLHEDQKLQNSLNNIANRQLRDAFPSQNQAAYENDPPTQQQQQQMYGGQQLNQRSGNVNSNKSTVQKVYGQKVGVLNKKNPKNIKRDENQQQQQQQQNRNQNMYAQRQIKPMGYQNVNNNNSNNPRFYQNNNNSYNVNSGGPGQNINNNNIDQIFDENQSHNFKSPQQQQFSFENNFKNTQKIYSAPLGVVGRQQQGAQVNNFMGGGGSSSTNKMNKNNFEMPQLNQSRNNNMVGNFFPDQERKMLKKAPQKQTNRPSTAPSKQKNDPYAASSKGPVNGFSMRNNLNKHNTHQDLFISGSQRQKSASNKQDDFNNKKMRCSSPGNFYSQNQIGKSNKWKV